MCTAESNDRYRREGRRLVRCLEVHLDYVLPSLPREGVVSRDGNVKAFK